MARRVTFKRFRFDPVIWQNAVSDARAIQRLGRAFTVNRLFGPEGEQYGFVNCIYRDGIVIGYFTTEGAKEITRYDSNVQLQTTTENSFAHILFALHLESGILAVQHTRIVGFVNLALADMRRRFSIAVEDLIRSVGLQVILLDLIPDKIEVTTEQLYRIFREYKTTYLKVVNLKGRQVPNYDEFKIFNPRVEQDIVYRQIYGEDIEHLDSLTLKTTEDDSLGNTALARLSARVGDVNGLTVDPLGNGQSFYITIHSTDRFTVWIVTADEKQPPTEEDIAVIIGPLTLPLRFHRDQQDTSQLLDGLITLANYAVDEGEADDDE